MHSKAHSHSSIFGMHWDPANAALAILLVLLFFIFLIVFLTLTAPPAMGRTYNSSTCSMGTRAAGLCFSELSHFDPDSVCESCRTLN
jgi:Na+/glutamate symporter